LRLKTSRSVAVTFVPPGDHLNPYPLATGVTMNDGWRVKVNSVIINADDLVEAVYDPNLGRYPNPPPPAGAQYTLINLTMKYVGGGSAYLGDFLNLDQQLEAEGAAKARYRPDACEPPQPDLGVVGQVFSGQAKTGNLCYEIASNDASSLFLTGYVEWRSGERLVWFALR
jgi:hypothetical protein